MMMELDTGLVVLLALILGLLVGSFLNVVIYRVPEGLNRNWKLQAKQMLDLPLEQGEGERFNILMPPSHCPSCKAAIKPWQNIPILSYVLLKGQCKHCHTAISLRYPLVELLTGLVFAVCAWKFGVTWTALAAMVFSAYLIAMIFIDADTQLLPDQLTLPLMWGGIVFHLAAYLLQADWGITNLVDSLLGAIVGYMSLWSIFQLFKLVTGKEGMGYGDFKLLAALGAWLGISVLPIIIIMSAVVGLIFALIMKVAKNQPMPFGPYLAISGWIVLVFSQPISQFIQWWLTKSGFIA
jgi:leader peptidase (prepilin peptidase)/N-methyltransferase